MKVIAEDEIWYAFFYTELTTGLRRGESGLKWEYFDEINGTLKICRTVYRESGSGLTAGDTKTSAGFTLDTYVHVTTEAQREAAKTVGSVLANGLQP